MGRIGAAAIAIACLLPAAGTAKTVEIETIPVTPVQESPVLPDEETVLPVTDAAETPPALQTQDRPQVLYNTAVLPKPVARMHAQLKEAALNGDLKRLRMVLESNEMPPTLSFGEVGDPIDFIRQSSGDGEGYEILAILADILDAGFVHVDAGTPQEMYVWPYFARYPMDGLTPDQKVELYRIVTAGDFAEMQAFGAWNFYRLGIGPDGTLHYFVAGD
ncbi:hypothetical protein [Roseibium sp. Sym1]|uniref:hypothetical protein n=1 Tax=Roseibium sp. Sym1 TaxID=3016006 RepID=UPI0022B4EE3D|nr:hypothetical protein [Roseibium sp. Sym1]